MSAPAPLFLAPAFTTTADGVDYPSDHTNLAAPVLRLRPAAGPFPSRRGAAAGGLRMTRGAREAATGMNVTDAEIQRCLDEPDDVAPDPNHPNRTRFRRGKLTVLAGADGMVLRVNLARRGR